jgi:septal ring factor EnvC (AmiA/AmiB activator)
MALVILLQGEKDKALAELTISKAEKEQMGTILAQVESNIAETLDSTELSPEPTIKELSQELDECRRALQQTQDELENTKEELARAGFRLRGQAAKIRRQSGQAGPDD